MLRSHLAVVGLVSYSELDERTGITGHLLTGLQNNTQQVLQTEEETSCRFNVVHAHQVYWLIQVTLKLECDFHQWDDISCTW